MGGNHFWVVNSGSEGNHPLLPPPPVLNIAADSRKAVD